MRVFTVIILDFRGAKEGHHTKETFWQAYYQSRDETSTFYTPAFSEMRLLRGLEISLNDLLSSKLIKPVVICRSITYGSALIGLDTIVSGADKLGLGPDDIVSMIQQYVPVALMQNDFPPTIFNIRSSSRIIDPNDTAGEPTEESAASPPTSLQEKVKSWFWITSNLSLVIPAALFAFAAWLMFSEGREGEKATREAALAQVARFSEAVLADHARFSEALQKERGEIAQERRSRLDRLDDHLQGLEKLIASEAERRSRDVIELETALFKARLEQAKVEGGSQKADAKDAGVGTAVNNKPAGDK